MAIDEITSLVKAFHASHIARIYINTDIMLC